MGLCKIQDLFFNQDFSTLKKITFSVFLENYKDDVEAAGFGRIFDGIYCPCVTPFMLNCPAGNYCPDPKLEPIICPKGYYCPERVCGTNSSFYLMCLSKLYFKTHTLASIRSA